MQSNLSTVHNTPVCIQGYRAIRTACIWQAQKMYRGRFFLTLQQVGSVHILSEEEETGDFHGALYTGGLQSIM